MPPASPSPRRRRPTRRTANARTGRTECRPAPFAFVRHHLRRSSPHPVGDVLATRFHGTPIPWSIGVSINGRWEPHPHGSSRSVQRPRLPPPPRRVRSHRRRHQGRTPCRPGHLARQRRHDIDQATQPRERVPHGVSAPSKVTGRWPPGTVPGVRHDLVGRRLWRRDDPWDLARGTLPVHTISPHLVPGRSPIGGKPDRDAWLIGLPGKVAPAPLPVLTARSISWETVDRTLARHR